MDKSLNNWQYRSYAGLRVITPSGPELLTRAYPMLTWPNG